MFNQYQSSLEGQASALQSQIASLQEQLSQLQAHQQAIGSVEQAAQSAIDQVRNALAMIQRIAPELASEFQDEITAVFADRPMLTAVVPDTMPEENATIVDAPIVNEDDPERFVIAARSELDCLGFDAPQASKDAARALSNAIDRVVLQGDNARPDNLDDLKNTLSDTPVIPALAGIRSVAESVLIHYGAELPKSKARRGRKPKIQSQQLAA